MRGNREGKREGRKKKECRERVRGKGGKNRRQIMR